MKKILLSLAVLSFASTGFAASLNSLNNAGVKNVMIGKTITTVSNATLNGKLVDNTFTGYINKDGNMTGKFATAPADGAPQTDKGTWKLQANGEFCFTWQNWFSGKQRCVTIYKLNNALLVVGPGNAFETLILDKNIQNGDQMSA